MNTERTFVYAIGNEDGPVKVGITTNITSRLTSLQTGSPRKLELIWVYTAYHRQEALDMERWFHRSHAEERLEGEWFALTAEQAWESLDQQVDWSFSVWGKEFHARRNSMEEA